MRSPSAKLVVLVLTLMLGRGAHLTAQSTGPTCSTGLCLEQVVCPGNTTTSITGTVYAPNGTDPLPNVTVYIPNAPVESFTPGVSCPVVGTPPSGSPLVGTTSGTDGSFELDNVPVGSDIPLVIVSGRWRRQFDILGTNACTNNPLPASFVVMPQNQNQGDIPKIAIATGEVDQVECVLRKVGINDSEFTDPSGGGRINFYLGSAQPGSSIDPATPTQASLMENLSTLESYDVLMLPCQGTPDGDVVAGPQGNQELANFIQFANDGGRIYSSHFSYTWMYQNPPFNGVVNWDVNQAPYPDGVATVNTSFTPGQTLAEWLQLTGASSTLGQIQLNTLKNDLGGVVPPTQSWLTLNSPGDPVMQFVFDTPIAPAGSTVNQCGRVLYNEYHVEDDITSSPNYFFPTECNSGPMTPQEKLLEYMLFELTDEGGQPSLAPTSQDFGLEAISYTSAPQTFTWTNNSSFNSQITSATATGDFSVTSNNCSSVPGGASCQIVVVFTPTALGGRSGTLTVVSAGNSLTASLTGTGVPGFSISANSLAYGNLDIGRSAAQMLTLTNVAPSALLVPPFVTTGEYAVSTAACGASIAALASCQITVTFQPTSTGPQNGTLGVNSTNLLFGGLGVTLTGNGVDFSLSLSPTSGSVVAGDPASSTATLTPIAGFDAPVTLGCNVAAAVATSCGLATVALTPNEVVSQTVSITTTAQYTVVGYGGLGGRGWLWLVALGSGAMLWRKRRSTRRLLQSGLLLLLLAAIALSTSGCSGKLPTQNQPYTGPGTYTITVTATDGFLVHTATYSLTVSSK
ncbi:MAG: choice-of-anchor D domain-containing protein [Acidobacteriaceae bacterium]|jgi:hypothetical protein